MKTIKERFEEFSIAGNISRVSENHILDLYIGLDSKKRKCIVLHSDFKEQRVKSTSAITVTQFKSNNYKAIQFSLTNEEMSGLFYKFCEDIIEQTSILKNKSNGYTSIVRRYSMWRKMFVKNDKKLLSESEIMGLIGEILFMSDGLAKRFGLEKALESWSGQELTHKDFSFGDSWAEVKTISSGSLTIKISSLEQLESDKDGELVVTILEKMSPEYNGITLNKLVLETTQKFINDDTKDLFMSKVSMQGFEFNDYYDGFVYELRGTHRYSVTSNFPKLTKKTVPPAILKATYEINRNDIQIFEIK